AGTGPEDIDFVEIPDNSSWHYLSYLEKMGFYEAGGADLALMAGETQLGGKFPVCPSGGVSSFGEAVGAQGLCQVCEVVTQLRGKAGKRQVENARIGMSMVYGVHGQSAAVILEK
ncbi:MAG: transporter, partial [Deltaproteobacteria bacterium]|nr:transporter [Deltaproteobacteria bacterium]